MGGFGHELLSFLFRLAHKNLSTLDPSSALLASLVLCLRPSNPPISNMTPFFDTSKYSVSKNIVTEMGVIEDSPSPLVSLSLNSG